MPLMTYTAEGRPIVIPIGGQPGLTGDQGDDGRSAYQIAVQVGGFAGSEADFAAMLMTRPSDTPSRIAAGLLPGLRMVTDAGNGLCAVTDPTDPAGAGLVLGFVSGVVLPGGNARILQGDLLDLAFSFGAPGPLYIADDGSLTLTPRTSGFSQVVGATPDGVRAIIRLGPARPIIGIGGGVVVPPSTEAIMAAVYAAAADGPAGQPPGTFYRNGGTLERTPKSPDGSIPTGVVRQALAQLWDTLPRSPDGVAAGRLWLNGRAFERVAPATPTSTVIPPTFLAALGALWDGAPTSPQGLGSRDFYRNGNALERIP